jgi:hypothetical protein
MTPLPIEILASGLFGLAVLHACGSSRKPGMAADTFAE